MVGELLGLSRADRALAAALIIVAVAAMAPAAWNALTAPRGEAIPVFTVRSASGLTTLPGDRDGVYTFAGPLGLTTVEVVQGRARIASSPCPEPCHHGGWLSRAGQTAVCLPNLVVLRVERGEASDLDGESY